MNVRGWLAERGFAHEVRRGTLVGRHTGHAHVPAAPRSASHCVAIRLWGRCDWCPYDCPASRASQRSSLSALKKPVKPVTVGVCAGWGGGR